MEFGRVTESEIAKVDFSLPLEGARNKRVIDKYATESPSQIYIGCAKWGRKDWVGKIYPKGTKDADFLRIYAKQFSTIELNATYYRMPNRAQVLHWKDMVGADFRFCPKFTDVISHHKQLKDSINETNAFLLAIDAFAENLGPAFLLLPPHFKPDSFSVLENYVRSLPTDFSYHIEFRHIDWYKPEMLERVLDLFEANNTGSIITDTSGRRDCAHMQLTNHTAFVRFVGNSLHPTDYSRVDAWIQRLKYWIDNKLPKIYFFMHQHEELHSPELCAYTIQQLNKHAGLSIKEPLFVSQQSLF